MKWSILQFLAVSLIIIVMWTLEIVSENLNIQTSSGGWTAVNSPLLTFLMIVLIMTSIYLIFVFEAKKEKPIFRYSIWSRMPSILVGAGVLSVILFIMGGIIGPLMEWVSQWRFLLYVFLIYFLLLIFLFIFSIELKRQKGSQTVEKTVHISFVWTLVLLFALFFLL
ncbi:hypothetical protein FZC78_11925 [Rossellomorea vietnamensis]|uniref:Uncharacterized protein n=1 Tax=Rossellomorea vietnamensis TaxID=218284 RepID=A0A5D4NS23_9BACI|nr:hypothetical protein [Rossellomorea vietnamensis]TYS16690.1 hypothetical protein FZC78_11925 [Rossellomorea vietnamensis]